ncbi:MAG TPA: transcription termination factor NusA, partial [Dehalococcoidales bacterium]
ESALITGLVQRVEPRQIFVDLGRTEAILAGTEQVPNERYRVGQRLKVVILEVVKTNKGPRVVVSRSHPDLVRRLFETEVPEIYNGTVEVKSIAREAGSRSKVAVAARQEGVDPVGCCVGLRGIRIQNIVTEINGEKIDVVAWSPEVAIFIANALSPAQIVSVDLHKGEGVATVVVPDRQLSLAIGKEGQNVRLAAKLTGWRIDIKSASAAEAEKAAAEAERAAAAEAKKAAQAEAATVTEAEPAEEVTDEEATMAEEVPAEISAEPELAAAETAKPPASLEPALPFAMPPFRPSAGERSKLRFAEDIMRPGATNAPAKKKKKKARPVRESEEGAGGKRVRRDVDLGVGDEEEEY